LQQHLLRNLLPDDISRTVLKHLGQFAANAGGLTLVGFLFVLGAALMLLLTVENTLNRIWQVRKPRPLLQAAADVPADAGGRPAGCWARACGRPRTW
jgi:membrane protein